MKYEDVFEEFTIDDKVCVLVETEDGLKALSQHNFSGGTCGCCKNCDAHDELEVVRVFDMETMRILYDRDGEIDSIFQGAVEFWMIRPRGPNE